MIELNNFTKEKISGDSLKRISAKVLAGEKKEFIELSISLVLAPESKRLNKRYRKIDKPTDVLSFAFENSLGRSPMGESGEVVLCPKVIAENAKKYSLSFKSEITRVLVHGVLHILGYDHESGETKAQKMRSKEEKYLKN
jgi:probable rRNA maturation factor